MNEKKMKTAAVDLELVAAHWLIGYGAGRLMEIKELDDDALAKLAERLVGLMAADPDRDEAGRLVAAAHAVVHYVLKSASGNDLKSVQTVHVPHGAGHA